MILGIFGKRYYDKSNLDIMAATAVMKQPVHNPAFWLRGVDIKLIEKQYKDGFYANISLPETKIMINRDVPVLAPQYGTSHIEGIYSIKNKLNQAMIIATTMDKPFRSFVEAGQRPKGGRCWWCRYDFTTEVCGSVIGQSSHLDENTGQTIHIFWIYGIMCDNACVLAHDRDKASRLPQKRDPSLQGSESGLKFLHKLEHPYDEELQPAGDWSLLDINGGSLAREQYKSKKYTYQKLGNLIIIPAKMSYLQKS
jgi:hypothetical protein